MFDLDTGAEISAISKTVYESLSPQPKLLKDYPVVLSAGGKVDNVLGLVRVKVQFGIEQFSSYLLVVENLPVDCLLCRDLLPFSIILRKLSREIQSSIRKASKHLVSQNLEREDNSIQQKKTFSLRSLKPCKPRNSELGKNYITKSKRHIFSNQVNPIHEEIGYIEQTRDTIKTKLSTIAAATLTELGCKESSLINHRQSEVRQIELRHRKEELDKIEAGLDKREAALRKLPSLEQQEYLRALESENRTLKLMNESLHNMKTEAEGERDYLKCVRTQFQVKLTSQLVREKDLNVKKRAQNVGHSFPGWVHMLCLANPTFL
ncbi:hypothetical protein BpHYR1_000093 [Brachionus plicatilis]|uniref:Peptidase A2 domain-containing protein n=1 Tax=Brachionus plicatilis TaxID=10195 RepID=A0A3M7PNP6_BRAPC|nr:hypothetical protein BpHYR1_000093 [Brachionus plicatilis]